MVGFGSGFAANAAVILPVNEKTLNATVYHICKESLICLSRYLNSPRLEVGAFTSKTAER